MTPPEFANVNWYIMRPVSRDPPLCSLKELKDGTYSMDDLADFHELMDVEEEYLRRYREHEEMGR